jgi:hypothetical protein
MALNQESLLAKGGFLYIIFQLVIVTLPASTLASKRNKNISYKNWQVTI